MVRLRHAVVALGAVLLLAGCGQDIKKYAVPPSTYHSAQQFGDLTYAQASAKERLDLKIPEGSKPVPLVIIVHGGDWQAGDKGLPEVDATRQLLQAGFAVAAVNYRLISEATWPGAVQDVKAAIRWLRAHAAQYYLDPNHFAIWGASAGGYLAAAAGITGNVRTVFDDPSLGDLSISSAVQAVIVWAAPVDFLSLDSQAKAAGCLYQGHGKSDSAESKWLGGALDTVKAKATKADLLAYVPYARNLPPFQIVHGAQDCVIPPAQSKDLDKALKQAGDATDLKIVKGQDPVSAKFNRTQIRTGIAFLSKTLD